MNNNIEVKLQRPSLFYKAGTCFLMAAKEIRSFARQYQKRFERVACLFVILGVTYFSALMTAYATRALLLMVRSELIRGDAEFVISVSIIMGLTGMATAAYAVWADR